MNLDMLKINMDENHECNLLNENSLGDLNIAIIGMSIKAPGANNIDEFWDNIKSGNENVRNLSENRRKKNAEYFKYLGCTEKDIQFILAHYLDEIDEFDYSFFNINPKEAELMDPCHRLFLQTAWEAIEDSGYGGRNIYGTNTGVYVGYGEDPQYLEMIKKIDPSILPIAQTGNMRPVLASRVSYLFDLKGPNMVIDTTCSSSLAAIHLAAQALKNKECDMAIAGGVSVRVLQDIANLDLGVGSERNKVRAFDDEADGTMLGEGVGAVILKPLKYAVRDHDQIYGVIRGSGINQDGKSAGLTTPNQKAQEELITTVWEKSGVLPEKINYMEAHGTGTKIGDPIEIKGIKKAFERYTDKKQFCPIGSVKTNIGHTVQASGVISIIKILLMMQERLIPPSINFEYPNQNINFENTPIYVNNQLSPLEDCSGNILCSVSSFGVSGTNVYMMLEKNINEPALPEIKCDKYLLTLSAKSQKSLDMLVEEYKKYIKKHSNINLANLCYTANTKRGHFEHRIAIVFQNQKELLDELNNLHQSGVYITQSVIGADKTKKLSEMEKNEQKSLDAIAVAYVNHQSVNFQKLYSDKQYATVHIPTYQFEKISCWFDVIKNKTVTIAKTNDIQNSEIAIDDTILLKGSKTRGYTKTERIIATLLKVNLGFQIIDINQSIGEMGGDSIVLMKLHKDINKTFNIKLAIADLYSYPTVSKISEYIDNNFLENYEETKVEEPQVENNSNDIAIIGMSGKMPEADSVDEFWKNLMEGKESVREIPNDRKKDILEYLNYKNEISSLGGFNRCGYMKSIDKFDWKFFGLSPREANCMDPHQRIFLQETWKTFEDAGYCKDDIVGTNTGIFLGYTQDFRHSYFRIVNDVDLDAENISSFGNVPAVIPSRISYLLDLKGPCMIVDTACSSSLVAVHLACESLIRGESDMAIAGGARVDIMPTGSKESKFDIQSDKGHLRAFDDNSSGVCWGEGVVALLLKPLNKARKDGDHIYGVIKGSVVNQDGASMGISTPNPEAQAEMIAACIEKSNVNPETIQYIESHGTGTEIGDPIEFKGITQAFRRFTDKRQFCGLGSLKSNIGHSTSTSGIISMIKLLLALKHQKMPRNINWEIPNDAIEFENSPIYFIDKMEKWKSGSVPRRCAVNAFGFSGTNCHVIMEEYHDGETAEENQIYLLNISAKSKTSLWNLLNKYKDFFECNTDVNLSDLCFTASCGRSHYELRTCFVFETYKELKEKLNTVLTRGFDTFVAEIKKNMVFTQSSFKKSMELENKFLQSARKDRKYLEKLSELYISGLDIDWNVLYADKQYHRMSIPTYAFDDYRCWIKIPDKKKKSDDAVAILQSIKSRSDTSDELQQEIEKVIEEMNKESGSQNQQKQEVTLLGKEDGQYTKLERTVGRIWCEVLGLKEIDIDISFYEVGGHSIAMMQIVAKINKELHLDLHYNEFNDQNTVRALAHSLEEKEMINDDEVFPQIVPDPESMYEKFNITDIQMSYLLGSDESFSMGGVNTQMYFEFESKLDITRLNVAFNKVIKRHPMLRTVIYRDGTQQILKGDREYKFEVKDISNLSQEDIEEYIKKERKRLALNIVKVDAWPKIGICVLKVSDEKNYLFTGFDSIVADGASLQLIAKDWMTYYKEPDIVLPELKITFRDYMMALDKFKKSKMYEVDKQYWLDRLDEIKGAPKLLYKVDPTSITNPNFVRLCKTYTKEQWNKIKKVAQMIKVSTSSLLCTAYAEVLSYWSNQSSFTINLTVFNRLPFHEDVNKIVGDFTSVMLITVDLHEGASFFDRVADTQKAFLESLEHRSFDGVQIIRALSTRDNMSGQPIMPIVFTSMLFDGEENPWTELGELKNGMSQTPQVYLDHQAGEIGGQLIINWDYVKEIFDEKIITSMFEQYTGILDYLCSSEIEVNDNE